MTRVTQRACEALDQIAENLGGNIAITHAGITYNLSNPQHRKLLEKAKAMMTPQPETEKRPMGRRPKRKTHVVTGSDGRIYSSWCPKCNMTLMVPSRTKKGVECSLCDRKFKN